MPFATTPFGMTSWTPQTREDKVSGTSYSYEDGTISGFIGTHQPAVWMGDYGYVTLMPWVDSVKVTREARALPFSHGDEQASPYCYAVSLQAGSSRVLKAEMTATDHCAIMRFTFPKNDHSGFTLEASRRDIPGFISIDPVQREIVGYNTDRMDHNLGPLRLPHFKGYFVARFDKPFTSFGTYQGDKLQEGQLTTTDKNVGGYVTFGTTDHEQVQVKVGTSFISIDQARANLDDEIPRWDFDDQKEALKAIWAQKLDMFQLEGASEDERKIFYTALFHCLLYPKLFSEHGKYYSAFDDSVHQGESYTAYSLWDIFRAEFSLLTVITPERIDGMVNALLQDYKEGGWMPKWPNPSYTNIMIATHADSVVAEAIHKGFNGFDHALAYKAMYHDAMDPPEDDTKLLYSDREEYTPYEARAGLTYLKKLGYIPVDKTAEAASSTLEDAYDDWCVAESAKTLEKKDDYQFFLNRSLNYKNIYNKTIGMMQGRNADGSWSSLDAGWTEGNTWVYSFSVLHDIPGLIQLMGGTDAFNKKLDEHFSGGHNDHSNEPCHHYPYLYDYSGQPFKTQAKVREIAAKFYGNRVDGLDGDDDCGQMSAWYVFSALGFYPLNPASGDYLIGSPLYSKITMNLPNGKSFIITAKNNSTTNVYIQSAALNGIALNRPVITYQDIERGGGLDFIMGPLPSTWGSNWKPEPLPAYPTAAPPNRP